MSSSIPSSSTSAVAGLRAYITLIRHGESMANVAHILQGQSDSPLTVYGTAQIEALGKYWRSQHEPAAGEQSGALPASSLSPLRKFPRTKAGPCSLLVASPVGRANKTADAIARNVIDETYGVSKKADFVKGKETSILDPDFEATLLEEIISTSDSFASSSGNGSSGESAKRRKPAYFLDRGLAERDFGHLESTKGGSAPAGYVRGTGAGESKLKFEERVRLVGSKWICLAWKAAKERRSRAEQLSGGGSSLENPFATVGKDGKPPADTEKRDRGPDVHIILVSHGLWISTFFFLFLGPDSKPAFAANTGQFTIELSEGARAGDLDGFFTSSKTAVAAPDPTPKSASTRSSSALPRIRMIITNELQHLSGVKRQRGGIGRLPEDGRQPKLSSFFGASPSKKPRSE